ncbi:hypothetical protein QTO34_015809 [Cnephaeus nilssonii]|uniref:Uncharacterized protein n=1 Tax=Cnephaeus nilssonii TaxID=3371016 RepID=A0AA40I4X0_CNENI|nr:hypothetical protein QTO34_015809 [Eptesicus nilssonii]
MWSIRNEEVLEKEARKPDWKVAGDMLSNSTEQAITTASNPQSITEYVKQICVILLEFPHPPEGHGHPVLPPAIQFSGHFCRWSGQDINPKIALSPCGQG